MHARLAAAGRGSLVAGGYRHRGDPQRPVNSAGRPGTTVSLPAETERIVRRFAAEHDDLRDALASLRVAAEQLSAATGGACLDVLPALRQAHAVLTQRVLPHEYAEETRLYPALTTSCLADFICASDSSNRLCRLTSTDGVSARTTALSPTPALRAALPPSISAGEPTLPGRIPRTPTDLTGADAIVFVADTHGTRHQYW